MRHPPCPARASGTSRARRARPPPTGSSRRYAASRTCSWSPLRRAGRARVEWVELEEAPIELSGQGAKGRRVGGGQRLELGARQFDPELGELDEERPSRLREAPCERRVREEAPKHRLDVL